MTEKIVVTQPSEKLLQMAEMMKLKKSAEKKKISRFE